MVPILEGWPRNADLRVLCIECPGDLRDAGLCALLKQTNMTKANLKQQLEAFKQGRYLDSDGNESWCYTFYDWFCKNSSLEEKSKKLFRQYSHNQQRTPRRRS
jgi:hypothetical protein